MKKKLLDIKVIKVKPEKEMPLPDFLKKGEKAEEMVDDVEMGLDSAAEEILAALESKDVSALKEALKSFMVQSKEEPEEEYDDEGVEMPESEDEIY